MLGGLAALLMAAAAALFGALSARVAARAWARYRAEYTSVARDFGWEFLLFVDARQMRVLGLFALFVAGLAGAVLAGALGAAAFGAAGYLAPGRVARWQRRRRLARFERQLGDALPLFASALRAGLTLPGAIEHVASTAASPLQEELFLCLREMKLGLGAADALTNLSNRVPSEALALTVVAANIARQLGGNLAEIFETISATVRERIRLQRRIDALTSQGRMQGWIIGLLPLALGLAFNAIRPDLVGPMFGHWFGYALVAAVLGMEVAGIVVIRRIVAIDV